MGAEAVSHGEQVWYLRARQGGHAEEPHTTRKRLECLCLKVITRAESRLLHFLAGSLLVRLDRQQGTDPALEPLLPRGKLG